MLHCWKDYRTHLEDNGLIYSDEWADTYQTGNKTCVREADHGGDHDFLSDDLIMVAVGEG